NQFLVLVCLVIVLGTLLQMQLMKSRLGRAFVAIREDDLAAKSIGVNTSRYKVLTFALGAAYAGAAGSLYASFVGFISPSSFSFGVSITLVAMLVLGGLGNIWGVYLGVLILGILPELSRSLADYRMVAYGLLLVLLMRYRPQGILGANFDLKHFFLTKYLRRKGAAEVTR
ncbi:MAG: branched-chain amino acid ABC transporter permease, partial [Deltaproteobacteria bacterium]|nr:branched-chain amino acid ABC transporter permease [Deltaproteobacteria bacterium]